MIPASTALRAEQPALLCGPTNPVEFSPFLFGGDDTCNGSVIAVEKRAPLLQANEAGRMKIVAALGGESAVRCIPKIALPLTQNNLSDYFDCIKDTACLPNGHSIAQGEDAAGRKVVVMHVINIETKEEILCRIFQRRRETCIVERLRGQREETYYHPLDVFKLFPHRRITNIYEDRKFGDGQCWVVVATRLDNKKDFEPIFGVDRIAARIKTIVTDQDPVWRLKT